MDDSVKQLKSKIFSLKVFHKGAATLRHAIKEGQEDWQEYYPNHFIYAYLAFNSLYNVDWDLSCKLGSIMDHQPKIFLDKGSKKVIPLSEGDKQNKFLKFCFHDKQFVRVYQDLFIKLILKENTEVEVKEMLMSIRRDYSSNGSVRTDAYINRFQVAMEDLLFRKRFDKDTMSTIVTFIYNVRCNIFHGVKSIEDMLEYGQQDRLDIYASIIIALNQMVFSYLDYHDRGESIVDSFDDLYEQLA